MTTQDEPSTRRRPEDDDAIDRAIVARIRVEGLSSRRAWGELVARYQHRLMGVCERMVGNRETAADLVQDSFVKALQGLDSWDARSKLSTWMYRVTMNVCLSHLRSAKLRRHASLDAQIAPSLVRGMSGSVAAGHAQERELSPDESVQQQQRRRRILAALNSLEPEPRAILVLRDVQGLEYQQIAQALNIAEGTVKSRLFRARLALREALEGQEAADPEPE